MTITPSQLKQIAPNLKEPKLSIYTDMLNSAMDSYEIDTPERQAAFLAQVMHESAECRYVKELASGAAYEGRANLGNTQPGDGVRFKGRGLIQITGRANYAEISEEFDHDFVNNPADLEEPEFAALSAAWYWDSRDLNDLADTNTDDSFKRITRKINGGYNGLEDRIKYWKRAKAVLGA